MPLLERIIGLVAPHTCVVCGSEGRLVCQVCEVDAFPALPSRCFRCKRITTEFAVCDRDRKQTRIKHVWVRTDYASYAKTILHHYKYERARAAAGIIAEALDEVVPFLAAGTLVVPIPTATSRVRERGYDHAALLARAFARQRCLVWQRAVTRLSQSRQVGASRQKRIAQLRGNFLVTKPALVHGSHVLLVDDVVTTGATLEAVALVLKQAGAKSVTAAVFAQKQ